MRATIDDTRQLATLVEEIPIVQSLVRLRPGANACLACAVPAVLFVSWEVLQSNGGVPIKFVLLHILISAKIYQI